MLNCVFKTVKISSVSSSAHEPLFASGG